MRTRNTQNADAFYAVIIVYSILACRQNKLILSLVLHNEQRHITSTGTKYWRTYVRSNQWSFSMKKCVLKSFAIFTWKNMWWRLFLITLQGFRPATLLKRDWNTGVCVPVNIAKFSRTPILKNILEQLLLIGKIF